MHLSLITTFIITLSLASFNPKQDENGHTVMRNLTSAMLSTHSLNWMTNALPFLERSGRTWNIFGSGRACQCTLALAAVLLP